MFWGDLIRRCRREVGVVSPELFQADSTDRWHWSEDIVPAVDFCVRVLLLDGLRIAPFDQHPDGDHRLRNLGLDVEAWRTWVAAVVAARGQLGAHVWTPESPRDRTTALADLAEAADTPAALCPGTGELRARLAEMWVTHQPVGDRWKRRLTMGKLNDRLAPRHQRWLWQALLPFHDWLETLAVFLVDYPTAAVMALAPTSCVIARDPSDADGSGYVRLVLRAAEELAAE
jgi:hypothetical protein